VGEIVRWIDLRGIVVGGEELTGELTDLALSLLLSDWPIALRYCW
jgi:hypothetical protein